VESRIFQLLVLFGFLALFGFGYVSVEIGQHRRRVNDAVARGYNPYISGEPVRREDMFFGRHELLQRIVSTLHNNSIMIHGERRIGKTTLLYQLANTLRQIDDSEYWFVALYVDLEGTTEDIFFHLLMDEIAQHVRSLEGLNEAQHQGIDTLSYHTISTTAYTDRSFSRDLRQIVHLLDTFGAEHYAGRQVRLILLMDEMDTLSRYNHLTQQQLRRIFMREFAASVGAVVAGIEINKDWERVESPWFNLFNEIAMQPFTRNEAIRLLVEPVRGCYIFEPAAVDFILQQSEGRPHRIQQYAMEAVNEMLRHKRRRITIHDVTVAHELIQWDSQAATPQAGAPAASALSMGSPSPGAA
jgi:MoxR-like ATPase